MTELEGHRSTFETLGPHYDHYTARDDYVTWGNHLVALAAKYGLTPPAQALDLACGTGKSARELVRHGFTVDACDISAGMLRQARDQADLNSVRFFAADMRDLNTAGKYDLINCQDDALNFLADPPELRQVFSEVGRHLTSHGLFIFDVNTWLTYNTWYSQTEISSSADTVFIWHGRTQTPFTPGSRALADLYILQGPPGQQSTWSLSRHAQRHFTPATIATALQESGLEVLGVFGLTRTAPLKPAAEKTHGKAIYVTRPAKAPVPPKA